ncbi:hypothetical protein KBA39_07395 [Myxococcota bacterium]|nr:hypothetical protein [Myxococcota bacterium]
MNFSNFDLLIFDMEDALVDRSDALGSAVSRAVDTYLTMLLGLRPEGGPVFSVADVAEFVSRQQFEEPIDVFHCLLSMAISVMPIDMNESDFFDYDGRDVLEAVKNSGRLSMSLGELSKMCNVQEFSKTLRGKGGGLKGLKAQRNLRNQWLVLAEGHIMMDNLVKRIFAEVYLENELFMKEYGVERRFITDRACIRRERGYLEPDEIDSIRRQCPISVVTARDLAEAQFVLDNIGIGRYIDCIVSADAMGMGMADPDEVVWIRSLGVGGAEAADYATRVADAIERTRAQEALDSVIRIAWIGDCTIEGRNMSALKDRYGLTIIGISLAGDPKNVAALKDKGADIVVSDPESMLKAINERQGRARRPGRGAYND